MRSSRPPVLAVWLFQHLTRREHREALAGDLLEEYSRRSDSWYWRQVLAAIAVDFRTSLRSRWVSVALALLLCGHSRGSSFFSVKDFSRSSLQEYNYVGPVHSWLGLRLSLRFRA